MSDTLAALLRPLLDAKAGAAPAAPGWLVLLVGAAAVAMLVEAVLLLAWHRRTGTGLAPRTLLPTLVAGGALMAALLAALTGAPPLGLLALLALAGIAHVLDLRRRWTGGTAGRG